MGQISSGQYGNTGKAEAERELREHGKTLKEDVKILKNDVSSAASTAGELVGHGVDRVTHAAQRGGDTAVEAYDTMRRTVKEHPTAAVLTTLGIGVLIGRLFSGR